MSKLSKREQSKFHRACRHGFIEEIRSYLTRGGEVDLHEEISGLTPLQGLSLNGDLAAMGLLLEHGANPNLVGAKTLASPGVVVWTPLMCAYKNVRAIRMLLSYGADPDIQDAVSQSTVLHLAASNNHEDASLFLLNHGARRDLLDKDGFSPLQLAQRNKCFDVVEAWVNFEAAEKAQAIMGESSGLKPRSL